MSLVHFQIATLLVEERFVQIHQVFWRGIVGTCKWGMCTERINNDDTYREPSVWACDADLKCSKFPVASPFSRVKASGYTQLFDPHHYRRKKSQATMTMLMSNCFARLIGEAKQIR